MHMLKHAVENHRYIFVTMKDTIVIHVLYPDGAVETTGNRSITHGLDLWTTLRTSGWFDPVQPDAVRPAVRVDLGAMIP